MTLCFSDWYGQEGCLNRLKLNEKVFIDEISVIQNVEDVNDKLSIVFNKEVIKDITGDIVLLTADGISLRYLKIDSNSYSLTSLVISDSQQELVLPDSLNISIGKEIGENEKAMVKAMNKDCEFVNLILEEDSENIVRLISIYIRVT